MGITSGTGQDGGIVSARLRRRLLRLGGVALVVLVVGAWLAYSNLGTARFLPSPESDISAIAGPGDWPMAHHDPAHSGSVDAGGELKGVVKWRFEAGASVFGSPAVEGGRVYLGTGDGRVLALDAESGRPVWEHETGTQILSSPALAGKWVFVGTGDGRIVALGKDDGREQWTFQAGGAILSSPAVYDGVLYVGSEDDRVYALDAATGRKRWRYSTDGRVSSGPVVNDRVVAVNSRDSRVYVIGVRTAKGRLDYVTSAVEGAPTLDGNRLYVADTAGVLRAIDWRKRSLPFEKVARWARTQLWVWGIFGSVPPQKGFVWAFVERDQTFVGAPVVADGRVFVASRSGGVFAVDSGNGEPLWTFRADDRVVASPSVAGETLFVGDMSGRLHAVDALTGQAKWRFDAGLPITSTPVFAGGTLYLTSEEGVLLAVE